MFSLGWTPCPGVDPFSLVKFWRQNCNWKNHSTQHVQMRCKLLAAAPFVLQAGYSSIDMYSSFLCTPSSSFSSPLLPSSPLSPLLSFPPSPFSFSFNSHVSPLLHFFSSPPLSSPFPSPTPLPFSLPDTPLLCVAGVRMLRRDHHSLS